MPCCLTRLNVTNGLREFYTQPWTRKHFEEPLIDEVSDNIDVLEASFNEENQDLRFTLAARKDRSGDTTLRINNISRQARKTWRLLIDDVEIASGSDGRSKGSDNSKATINNNSLEITMQRPDIGSYSLRWS